MLNCFVDWEEIRQDVIEKIKERRESETISDSVKLEYMAMMEQNLFIIAGALAEINERMEGNNGE